MRHREWGEGTKKRKIMAALAIAIAPFLSLFHTYTHSPLKQSLEMKALCGLPSPPIRQHPAILLSPSPDPHPAHPVGQTCIVGLHYSVTFPTHWFFCALFDLLSRLPQPAKRGKIIHQRPLRWETIYRPPTQSHRSTKHSHRRTHAKVQCGRKNGTTMKNSQ